MKKFILLGFSIYLLFITPSYAKQGPTFRLLQIELGTLQAIYINNKLLSEVPENQGFKTEVWYPQKLGTFEKHERVEITKLSENKWKIQNPETGVKVEFSVIYLGGQLVISRIEPQTAQETKKEPEVVEAAKTKKEEPAVIESTKPQKKEPEIAEDTKIAKEEPKMVIDTKTMPASEEKTAKPVETQPTKPKDYIIANGDILEINTWKEPELSRNEVIVRMDGKFSFPLLNDVQASGLTALELKSEMEKRLRDYVENPVVTVVLKKLESQKFYVLGEVQKKGEYPLTKNVTVLQAVAMAGGFTEWADRDEIILMRKENGVEKKYNINYDDIIEGKDPSQNLLLKTDDTIIVP